jgi:hypothetical protein
MPLSNLDAPAEGQDPATQDITRVRAINAMLRMRIEESRAAAADTHKLLAKVNAIIRD